MTYEKCSYNVKRIFYEKGDYIHIRQHLNNIDWKKLMSGKDVQQKYNVFAEIVKMCKEKYIPSKILEKNCDFKFTEQLPNYIRTVIRKKHNLWKCYIETKKADTFKEYCKSRNKVKNITKFFRKQKEREISMNAKTNNKAFWKYTNSKTKVMGSIASLH